MSNSIFTWVSIFGFVLFILAILTVFALGVYFLLSKAKRRTAVVHQSWEEFAQAKNLTFEKISGSAYPKIYGTYRNRPATVLFNRVGRIWYTQVTRPVNIPSDFRLEIAPRSSLDWMVTGQKIEFGSQEFRTKYLIVGTISQSALAHLNSAVQAAILETNFSLLRLDKGTLTLRAVGFETRPQVLEAFLELTCTIAEALEQ